MYGFMVSNSGVKSNAVPSVAAVFAPAKCFHRFGWNSRSPLTSMEMQSVSGQSGELPWCSTTGSGTACLLSRSTRVTVAALPGFATGAAACICRTTSHPPPTSTATMTSTTTSALTGECDAVVL